MEYKEAIHGILKELKHLQEYDVGNPAEYENMAKSAINRLKKFLALDGEDQILSLWTNIETIGYHSVTYRGTATSHEIDFSNVSNHLKSGSDNEYFLREVLKMLSDPANPLRIKSAYQSIVEKLATFLRFVVSARSDAEHKLKDYICSCLLYDMNFYKDLINEDNLEGTQMLADIVESHANDDENDSVFSTNKFTDIYHTLQLGSNSPSFLAIYRLLLPILVTRPTVSVWKVSCSIVDVFKKHQHVSYFESSDKEIDISSLLPNTHQELNRKYISDSVDNQRGTDENAPTDPIAVFPDLVRVIVDLKDLNKDVNPEFPRLFKHYLEFLDQCLPMATKEDYEYIEEVPSAVYSILELESVTDLRSVLERFIFLQSLLSCDNPSSSVTLLMRASCFDFERLRDLEEQTYQVWVSRLRRTRDLEKLHLKRDKRASLLSKWRLGTKKRELRDRVTAHHYNEKLQLMTIRKLKVALRSTRELELKARQLSMNRYLSKWFHKFHSIEENSANAEAHYAKNLARKAINGWGENTNHALVKDFDLEGMCNDFIESCRQSLSRRIFASWYGRLGVERGMIDLFSKLDKFQATRNQFVVEIWFRKWQQSIQVLFNLKNFKYISDRRVVRIVFNSWRCSLQLDDRAQRIIHDRNIAKMMDIFSKWKLNSNRAQESRPFRDQKLIQRYFKIWRLKRKANIFTASRHMHTLSDALRNLRIQSIERHFRNETNRRLVVLIYFHWKEKFKASVMQDVKSIAFNDQLLRKFVLSTWKYSLGTIDRMELQAKSLATRKFLTKWRNRYYNWKQEVENVRVFNRAALKHAMSIWKDKYDDALEGRLATRIQYMTDYSNLLLKSSYFTDWREQFIYQMELQSVAFSFTPGQATFLSHWMRRTEEVQELNERVSIYEEGLAQRFLSRWWSRYEQIETMNEQGENQLAEQNFATLREITREWIFKFNKNIKRHYQLSKTFQERVDKRLVRNVMHLWLQKRRYRLEEEYGEEGEEEEFANETYVSNSSPLASRTHQQRQQKEKEERAVPTPWKQFSPSKISTPRSKVPSPSKLQETSQRMREQQISQLRERFSRAKLSPRHKLSRPISPVKLNYNVDLSPPKSEKFSDLGHESLSPNTSNSSSPTGIQSQLNYVNGSSSIISTAKRMGRIKPIAFPTGEENDVRLSPASKVKRESRILIE
ncbi:SFI1 [Candida margitis]|uniref:SFI1 n=1 Tax=Candida margitis TaxID=1775924 RepID=UPI002226D46B|nr:SFI1 [Candida margitis]KAI5958769.1 SFI1 [Candida margitis]